MRASVHIKIPNLTKGGSDEKAKTMLRPMGLSVRGMGGEHTPIGASRLRYDVPRAARAPALAGVDSGTVTSTDGAT
jgi:hypothetical protein